MKVGQTHADAMLRQGLAELREAVSFQPNSTHVEDGVFGTRGASMNNQTIHDSPSTAATPQEPTKEASASVHQSGVEQRIEAMAHAQQQEASRSNHMSR